MLLEVAVLLLLYGVREEVEGENWNGELGIEEDVGELVRGVVDEEA